MLSVVCDVLLVDDWCLMCVVCYLLVRKVLCVVFRLLRIACLRGCSFFVFVVGCVLCVVHCCFCGCSLFVVCCILLGVRD